MSKYELALVVNAKIEDEARAEVVEKAKAMIQKQELKSRMSMNGERSV